MAKKEKLSKREMSQWGNFLHDYGEDLMLTDKTLQVLEVGSNREKTDTEVPEERDIEDTTYHRWLSLAGYGYRKPEMVVAMNIMQHQSRDKTNDSPPDERYLNLYFVDHRQYKRENLDFHFPHLEGNVDIKRRRNLSVKKIKSRRRNIFDRNAPKIKPSANTLSSALLAQRNLERALGAKIVNRNSPYQQMMQERRLKLIVNN